MALVASIPLLVKVILLLSVNKVVTSTHLIWLTGLSASVRSASLRRQTARFSLSLFPDILILTPPAADKMTGLTVSIAGAVGLISTSIALDLTSSALKVQILTL